MNEENDPPSAARLEVAGRQEEIALLRPLQDSIKER
jgi:hypothetical protein